MIAANVVSVHAVRMSYIYIKHIINISTIIGSGGTYLEKGGDVSVKISFSRSFSPGLEHFTVPQEPTE